MVDLNKFKAPLVAVTTYLFDHSSVQIFNNEVSKYTKPITEVVNTIIPHIGLIAHEPQVTQLSSPK
jgi:hypothetical protein